ncbi:MAG: hypothetical protein ACREOR_05300, partial [Candidatus Binatia bacterium]
IGPCLKNAKQNDCKKIYRAEKSTQENPKFEYRKRPRGPKQTGGQTNPKLEKIQNPESAKVRQRTDQPQVVWLIRIEFVWNFGILII